MKHADDEEEVQAQEREVLKISMLVVRSVKGKGLKRFWASSYACMQRIQER